MNDRATPMVAVLLISLLAPDMVTGWVPRSAYLMM
jgi:hypothetical protein